MTTIIINIPSSGKLSRIMSTGGRKDMPLTIAPDLIMSDGFSENHQQLYEETMMATTIHDLVFLAKVK